VRNETDVTTACEWKQYHVSVKGKDIPGSKYLSLKACSGYNKKFHIYYTLALD